MRKLFLHADPRPSAPNIASIMGGMIPNPQMTIRQPRTGASLFFLLRLRRERAH
jgi:hypothetical protein